MQIQNTQLGSTQEVVYKNCHSKSGHYLGPRPVMFLYGVLESHHVLLSKERSRIKYKVTALFDYGPWTYLRNVQRRSRTETFRDDTLFYGEAKPGMTPLYTPSPVLRTSSPSRERGTTFVLPFPMRGKVSKARMRGFAGRFTARGFTLIELLVVVLIIGILAAVAVPQYQKAVDKTKVLKLLPLARAVKNEQELFYLANGRYASSWEELGTEVLPFPMNINRDFAYSSSGNLRGLLFGGKQYIGVGPFTPDFLWIWNYDHYGSSSDGILDCYAYNARAEKVRAQICTYNEKRKMWEYKP